MARIVLGSYMVRYPLGGMMSWVFQYLSGLRRLGHDMYFVEKSGYGNACFDPTTNTSSNDSTYGTVVVSKLLSRLGLEHRWCFVDHDGRYHGLGRAAIEGIFDSADLFVDMGTHGAWSDEARGARLRVLVDGEPGRTQIRMQAGELGDGDDPRYDRYYTVGLNVGTEASGAPTAGREWGHLFHPVDTEAVECSPVPRSAPFTTVMNWQTHQTLSYGGQSYGQKDVEFEKFRDLPQRVQSTMELSVGGFVPERDLEALGWQVRDGHTVTTSYESFLEYVAASAGEFSVCKNTFVDLNTGWFSDRSAAYLASGRAVVLEDTGFSAHLPTGEGLFAPKDVEEAAEAITAIERDPERHSRAARDIAREFLDARKVLGRFLAELGIC